MNNQEILNQLNGILRNGQQDPVKEDELQGVIEYAGTTYVISKHEKSGKEVFKSHTLHNGRIEKAYEGSAYTILKPIMGDVRYSPEKANEVTAIMSKAYSPLDAVFQQKGKQGEAIVELLRGFNGWEITEIQDFLEGMQEALRRATTSAPAQSSELYRDVDFDAQPEPEAVETDSTQDLPEEAQTEIAEFRETPVNDAPQIKSEEGSKETDYKALAGRFLSMFKRK